MKYISIAIWLLFAGYLSVNYCQDVSSKPELKVEWLGIYAEMDSTQHTNWNDSTYSARYIFIFGYPDSLLSDWSFQGKTQIGFRDDGLVVWRKLKKE